MSEVNMWIRVYTEAYSLFYRPSLATDKISPEQIPSVVWESIMAASKRFATETIVTKVRKGPQKNRAQPEYIIFTSDACNAGSFMHTRAAMDARTQGIEFLCESVREPRLG